MAMSSPAISPNLDDCKILDTHLYEELWYACAGLGTKIPQAGEPVVYFPQGHLEQTRGIPMHLHDVPSQILCRVVNVELKSEKDFVYARLVLQPELNITCDKGLPPLMPRLVVPYFCKKLRVADTMAHAWLWIPRKHAEKFLPPLDMAEKAPMQGLVAKDLSGMDWRFQHRLVRPRRHLLQIAEFATSKKLVAGDALVVLRGEDGELRVGVRRSMTQFRNKPSSEIPNDGGHEIGFSILPSISHAVTTRSLFTALYRPRTCTDQFVVPYDRYVKSIKSCSIGTRFRMVSTRELTTEHRVSGTISGTEDFDALWPGSKWRSLKVKWDKESSIVTSNRVSPWDIEIEKRCSVQTKRPRGECGSGREDRTQKAMESVSHNSPCADMESCLNNAMKVLQLCQHSSMMHKSSSLDVEKRVYLSAVDDLIHISMGSSSSGFSPADNLRVRAKAALDIAMSELARTFSGLKLWNTNHFEDLDRLKLYTDLSVSTSSEPPLSGNSDSTGASSRDSELDDCSALQKLMSCLEEKKLDLINSKSVSDVQAIAGRMVQAGYKERLREAFTLSTQELARGFHVFDLNWIFQCHSRSDEGDSWHGEDMPLQYWNSASQFITRVLVEMRRQLYEENFGAFDELKEDYFTKIVEQPVSKLLNSASVSAALSILLEEAPHGLIECLSSFFHKITHALSTYKTLTDVVPTLLELVSPESRELVSRETEAIREKVEDVVNRMLGTLTNVISSSAVPEAERSNIHPVSKAVGKGIVSLLQHRNSLDSILARNYRQTDCVVHTKESFSSSLLSNLITHSVSLLKRNCNGLVPKELQYIYLLNNSHFILKQVENSMMSEPFGSDWIMQHQKQIEQYLEEYIETSWAPVSSHLAGKNGNRLVLWKTSRVQRFITAFQSVCAIQRYWKVPDPCLRQMLRTSISQKIVGSYSEYLTKHQKDGKSLRVTEKDLENLLAELFEG